MRTTTLAAIGTYRCAAILRTTKASAVRPALEAAIAGGFRVLEITMNTPGALDHVATLRKEDPSLVVGVGTILSKADAQRAKAAGAHFLVSPIVDEWMIEYCKENDLVSIPGTFTPTEMVNAHRVGADIVKLFPAPGTGAAYVAQCLGPCPFLKIFPTSGVTEENVAQFFEAGCFGVGFVASLFPAREVQNGQFDVIASRAKRMTALVNELKVKFP